MEASNPSSRPSPFLPMFETFRSELDEHHDRRERIVKASRDVTAASKKIIFALQRVHTLGAIIPPAISKSTTPYASTINNLFRTIHPDLQSLNTHRYSRQISPGIQEYMEALLFQHYLATQTLLPYSAAASHLHSLCLPAPAADDSEDPNPQPGDRDQLLTPEDYILGLFDLTGELMRFAITSMATSSHLPSSSSSPQTPTSAPTTTPRTTLHDLHTLQHFLATLNHDHKGGGHFARDAESKLKVTVQSVEKVERALYGLVIRGSERPVGWMPDLREEGAMRGGREREEVEGY